MRRIVNVQNEHLTEPLLQHRNEPPGDLNSLPFSLSISLSSFPSMSICLLLSRTHRFTDAAPGNLAGRELS